MIKNKIFDELETIQDIICILSIFGSYKNENSSRFNKYYSKIYNKICLIKEEFISNENKYNLIINKDFWETQMSFEE
jgi:hypothetical protein